MNTIDTLIGESCRRYGDKTALRHKIAGVWHETTYEDLQRQSDGIAAGLVHAGFTTGDHAALLAPSSPRWVAVYLGILKAGGVAVPVDTELKSTEVRHILYDSDTKAIFSTPPHLDLVLEMAGDIPTLQLAVNMAPAMPGDVRSRAGCEIESLLKEWRDLLGSIKLSQLQAERADTLMRRIYRLLGELEDRETFRHVPVDDQTAPVALSGRLYEKGRLLSLEELCLPASPPPASKPRPDDTAVILYTSGTTGRAKGAMLSHANIVSNIEATIDHFRLDESIHTLSFLPINHVFEQVCGILLPLSLGGTVSFCESLKKLGENLTEVKPSFLLGVPAVYRMLLERIMRNINSQRLSQLLFAVPLARSLVTARVRRTFGAGTIFISGGAALDPAIAEGLTRLGLTIYQGYGITETSPVISAEQPGATRAGSVGRLLRGISARIDNPGEDGAGEILVKGPNIMQGYYKNPQATSDVIEEGWYHTGDIGQLDADGFLTIHGRVKNVIVTPNGKNVYPEEVENELLNSHYIAEAMVYGHMAAPGVEEVHAIIYPNQDALENFCRTRSSCPMSEADIEVLLRGEVRTMCGKLADYKRVRRFTIREDEFPKTTTRKIKRFAVEAGIPTGG